jgi:hypothetical protein
MSADGCGNVVFNTTNKIVCFLPKQCAHASSCYCRIGNGFLEVHFCSKEDNVCIIAKQIDEERFNSLNLTCHGLLRSCCMHMVFDIKENKVFIDGELYRYDNLCQIKTLLEAPLFDQCIRMFIQSTAGEPPLEGGVRLPQKPNKIPIKSSLWDNLLEIFLLPFRFLSFVCGLFSKLFQCKKAKTDSGID